MSLRGFHCQLFVYCSLTGWAGVRIMSWDEAPLVLGKQQVQVDGGGDALGVKRRQIECRTPNVEFQHTGEYVVRCVNVERWLMVLGKKGAIEKLFLRHSHVKAACTIIQTLHSIRPPPSPPQITRFQ